MKIEELREKRQQLIESIPPWNEVIRGTVYETYACCGKINCKCKKDDKFRHGPYYYLSFGDKGKTKMQFLHKDIKRNVENCVKQYNRLWKNLCELSEINLKLLILENDKSKGK